jgi:hypothetical protein
VDVHGLTPLHWLAQRMSPAEVVAPLAAALLRCGADLEAREQLYGAAPLSWAGWHGSAGAAAALLLLGADCASADAYHGTPGHWALMNGHAAAADVLQAALRQGRAAPLPPAAPAAVAAARAALHAKFGPRLEAGARGDVAVALQLCSLACEEKTSQPLPGPVRGQLAQLLMRHAFTLWPPTTLPRGV